MVGGINSWYGDVWAGMVWGLLIEVEGKMNADQYCQILSDGVVESFENWRWWYFQQDNDPQIHILVGHRMV